MEQIRLMKQHSPSLPPAAFSFHTPESVRLLNLSPLAIYTRYRGFPGFTREDHEKILRHHLLTAVNVGGVCASLHDRSTIEAVCAISPLPWDAHYFGASMLKMTVAATSRCASGDIASLINGTLAQLSRPAPPLHISCEVDIDQYNCLGALTSLGARILDIKREYRWRSLSKIGAPKFLSRVRDYQPSDKEQVLKLFRQARFESRFSRDPLLDKSRAARLYPIWLEKLLDSHEDDRIAVVREHRGTVQACGAIQRQDLGAAGVDVQLMSNGLYVSSRQATGSYYPIIYTLAKLSLARPLIAQTSVSLNNRAATRVLERMNAGTESIRYALRLSLSNPSSRF